MPEQVRLPRHFLLALFVLINLHKQVEKMEQHPSQSNRHGQGQYPGHGDIFNGFALQVFNPAMCNHRPGNTGGKYVSGTYRCRKGT